MMKTTFAVLLLAFTAIAYGQSTKLGPSGSAKPPVVDFLVADKNKDGKLTAAEASSAGISKDVFKKSDVNMNGILDQKEYKVAQTICC